MTALSEMLHSLETSAATDAEVAAAALAIVRDGVLTGEGPTTAGRVHFSRSLDADDAAWCARILNAAGAASRPVSRAEAQVLLEINAAATERKDNGRFDDLLAKAVVHHAASASGIKVPPRSEALAPETTLESWAPSRATDLSVEVLRWIAAQMRGWRHGNRHLDKLVASVAQPARKPALVADLAV